MSDPTLIPFNEVRAHWREKAEAVCAQLEESLPQLLKSVPPGHRPALEASLRGLIDRETAAIRLIVEEGLQRLAAKGTPDAQA